MLLLLDGEVLMGGGGSTRGQVLGFLHPREPLLPAEAEEAHGAWLVVAVF